MLLCLNMTILHIKDSRHFSGISCASHGHHDTFVFGDDGLLTRKISIYDA